MTLMAPSEMEIGQAHLQVSFENSTPLSRYEIDSATDCCEIAARLDPKLAPCALRRAGDVESSERWTA
jgi:hypothetical protein